MADVLLFFLSLTVSLFTMAAGSLWGKSKLTNPTMKKKMFISGLLLAAFHGVLVVL